VCLDLEVAFARVPRERDDPQPAYDAYFAGKLEDVEPSQSRIDAAIEPLPRVPAMP